MKKLLFISAILLLFVHCDHPGDCVKSTGPMTEKNFDGLVFSKIIVNKGIALVIQKGSSYQVAVHSGENLINDIEVNLDGGLLTLEDNTDCNWVRDYGQTTIYITAPNLTDVYSKTEQNITSANLLDFPNLRIVSMDTEDGFAGTGTGDFILEVHTDNLTIENNNVSQFDISGHANQLNANFYSGNGVLKAANLAAQKVHIYHRGTNDLFVHPLQEISGDIYNLGDVHAVFRPAIVNVSEHYRGKLIFD